MSTDDPSAPEALPASVKPHPAVASRAAMRRRTLGMAILIMLILIAASWFAHVHLSRPAPEPDVDDALALSVVGRWWNIAGDRYLALDWEGRRAWLRDFSASEAGVESAGSWRTTKDTVIVQVSGAAGELAQELELVGNDAEMFLAPAPATRARLLDSWIAEHEEDDEDDEDMSPEGGTAREARWTGARISSNFYIALNAARRELVETRWQVTRAAVDRSTRHGDVGA